ncbi:MAG: peptidylprolyl isomerase [Candidatus Competibacteraceae bacterium]|nr:peptidylprolyl isomerase [Candidatus Competibacteraceae bacterium]
MQISAKKVVTINYTLTDDAGNVIDKSDSDDFAYLHGAGNILPGLEDALTTKSSGDEVAVSLTAEEGYGSRDETKVQPVPRNMFPPDVDIQSGMQFRAQGSDGQPLLVTVANVEGDQVTVDGNHPLAGVNLNFQVKVVDVREATDEEVQHGHAHAGGEHDHG